MNRIIIPIIAAFAILASLFIGIAIAKGEYVEISLYAIIAVILYFIVDGWKQVWWFAAMLSMSGALFVHNFTFTGAHLFVLMLALASMISLIQRQTTKSPPEFKKCNHGTTSSILLALILYGVIHYIIYYAFPYSPSDYSIRTSTKAYFECYATMACSLWLLISPYGFTLKRHWPNVLIFVIFVSLLVNVAIRYYMYMSGFQASDGSGLATDAHLFSFYVPIINMFPGVYTLRNLCPIATVIVLMFASAPGFWRNSNILVKFAIVLTLILCVTGSVLSGGRATLLFCLALAGIVAIVRRKVLLVITMGVSGVLIVAAANLFAHMINTKAPLYISRSLQLVMFEKGDSYRGIEHSQMVRDDARDQALIEWRRDNRVLFFGRSVFYINAEDAEYNKKKFGNDGFVINNMRSGRTHNLSTNLLLQYGLTGCALYLVCYVLLIRFFIKLYLCIDRSKRETKSLVGAIAIYLPLIFIYQLLGGEFLPVIVPLSIGIARSALLQEQRSKERISVEAKKT